jgi:hypothetical protein
MKFRKLRIAWTVVWGLACVLLIAVWVRSYWRQDLVRYRYIGTHYFWMYYDDATLGWGENSLDRMESVEAEFGSSRWLVANSNEAQPFAETAPAGFSRWNLFTSGGLAVWSPIWFPTLLLAVMAAVPWIRWRYSLRTLLIATTLVAVVLGLIAWSMR